MLLLFWVHWAHQIAVYSAIDLFTFFFFLFGKDEWEMKVLKNECHFLVYMLRNYVEFNGSGELERSHLTCL